MTRGSIWIELVAWLFLVVPGIIYSLWRLTSRYKACPDCGETALVPILSPRGQILISGFSAVRKPKLRTVA